MPQLDPAPTRGSAAVPADTALARGCSISERRAVRSSAEPLDPRHDRTPRPATQRRPKVRQPRPVHREVARCSGRRPPDSASLPGGPGYSRGFLSLYASPQESPNHAMMAWSQNDIKTRIGPSKGLGEGMKSQPHHTYVSVYEPRGRAVQADKGGAGAPVRRAGSCEPDKPFHPRLATGTGFV